MTRVPFNKPYIAGPELQYVSQAADSGNIAGDGPFTKKCCGFMEDRFGIERVMMTPSCTAALEMAAILCDLSPGDEVIMPSYTFVSTANAFVRQGARPVFVDIRPDTLNLDEAQIEAAITSRTKAIAPVHYAGVGCEMDRIMDIAEAHGLLVVEDAAQGVHAYYKDRALGSIGHLAAYSFHDTKNYVCGEGGALCINSPELIKRAEIIRDKGTNRQAFFQGEVDKYTWVDIGSSYVCSELSCAFLYGQLELLEAIAERRHEVCDYYRSQLEPFIGLRGLQLADPPIECRNNAHMFYVLLENRTERDALMAHLKQQDVQSVFHYIPLHSSPMGRDSGYHVGNLPVTESISERILRLPLFCEITEDQQRRVVEAIAQFLESASLQTVPNQEPQV